MRRDAGTNRVVGEAPAPSRVDPGRFGVSFAADPAASKRTSLVAGLGTAHRRPGSRRASAVVQRPERWDPLLAIRHPAAQGRLRGWTRHLLVEGQYMKQERSEQSRRGRSGWFLSLTAALLIAVGCGTPTATPSAAESGPEEGAVASEAEAAPADSDILTYTGDDRHDRLLEGAREEATLTWYTSLAGDVVTAMEEALEEKYPDIALEVFRASSDDVAARVLQEAAAGGVRADVFELESDSAREIVQREQVAGAPFYSPEAAEVPDRFKEAEGELTTMAAVRVSYISFGYNESEVAPEAVPEQLEDLLAPELQGQLAITASSTGVRWVGSVLHALGEEEGTSFLQKVADQGIRVHGVSGNALMDMIAQGAEAASPAVFANHARQRIEDGAPVAWTPVDPVTANVGYAFLNGDTDRPHASLLFMDFIMGDEGRQVFEDNLYDSPTESVDFEVWIPDESFESPEEYGEAFTLWQETFDRLFGQGS